MGEGAAWVDDEVDLQTQGSLNQNCWHGIDKLGTSDVGVDVAH